MESQDDYEPSQDLGDSQLVLDHTELRVRKAAEAASANMTRFYKAGGDQESQYADIMVHHENEYVAESGLTMKTEQLDSVTSKSDNKESHRDADTSAVQVKQEQASMRSDSASRNLTGYDEGPTQWQRHELLTENTRLKEALERSRARGLQWLQFYAALKAVEVEAERRYKDVATILGGLGYEVPEYPQRLGNKNIEEETENWRVLFTQRWMEIERAEEAMFLPKLMVSPVKRSTEGEINSLGREKRDMKSEKDTLTGEESSSSKRKRGI